MAAMFSSLTERLSRAAQSLRGRGRLTEDNIAETLAEVRLALLEADVALPVVKTFIEAVKARSLGTEVVGSLTPGQAFIGIIHQQLVAVMGGGRGGLDLRVQPPAVILLAGLQGAGKTTTAGKLARHLLQARKRVLLVSTDIRRPAAVLQLQRLAEQVGADFFPAAAGLTGPDIARQALEQARRGDGIGEVGAQGEERAMGEVDLLHQPQDQHEAERDQREQKAERQPVNEMRKKAHCS